MKLFDLRKVEETEKKWDFIQFQTKNEHRRTASKKAVITKTHNLLKRVAKWEIYINQQNIEDIINAAIENYNSFRIDRSDEGFPYEPASNTSNPDFINRITVNYLRHQCSSYDERLIQIKGKAGKKEAYVLINQRIYNEIVKIYPSLEAECNRQLEAKIDKIVKEYHGL